MTPPVAPVPVAPEHAEAIQRLVTASRDVVEQTRLPDPYPEGGAAAWIECAVPRHRRGEEYSFAVVNRDGATTGACGLVVQEGRRAAELGYWIGAAHRGEGYASAAVREAVRFAFAEAGLERVFALPLATNGASRRVLEQAGFRLVRVRPAERRWAGQQQALYEVRRERSLAAPGVSLPAEPG